MITEELQKKIDRAIRLLKGYNNPNEPVEIAYSGGKDSDVILQLAKESGINYRAIYKNTTIDPPGTIAHVKEMGVEIMQPKHYTFREMIINKGMPSRLHRFCCAELKEYKILDKCIMGVRQDESKARAERYTEPTQCRWYGAKVPDNHVEAIYPIHNWTDQDVKDFIADRHIKCAPVYYDEQGNFHVERRLGCMCCPMASYKNRLAEFKEHPNMVKLYVKASQQFMNNHPNSSATNKHRDAYDYFVHYVFYPEAEKWEEVYNGMFGKPDCKSFLENYFKIKL